MPKKIPNVPTKIEIPHDYAIVCVNFFIFPPYLHSEGRTDEPVKDPEESLAKADKSIAFPAIIFIQDFRDVW